MKIITMEEVAAARELCANLITSRKPEDVKKYNAARAVLENAKKQKREVKNMGGNSTLRKGATAPEIKDGASIGGVKGKAAAVSAALKGKLPGAAQASTTPESGVKKTWPQIEAAATAAGLIIHRRTDGGRAVLVVSEKSTGGFLDVLVFENNKAFYFFMELESLSKTHYTGFLAAGLDKAAYKQVKPFVDALYA